MRVVRSDGPESIVYRNGENCREDELKNGKIETTVIARGDLGKMWSINHASKSGLEIKMPKQQMAESIDPDADLVFEDAGTVWFEGKNCLCWIGRFPDSHKGNYHRYLIDEDLQMRVQCESFRADGTLVVSCQRKDISLDPPDPAVFELPSDIKIRRR